MSFRLVPKSVILNDLKRRNDPYFVLFHRFRLRCRRVISANSVAFAAHCVKVVEHIPKLSATETQPTSSGFQRYIISGERMQGTPALAGLNTRGVQPNIAILDLSKAISQTVQDGKLVSITNRKSYISCRLVGKSVTLNDLERRNDPYFVLFHRFRLRCRRKSNILGLPRFQNLLLIVYDHINTICAIIQRLFGQNKRRQWPPFQTVIAYAHVFW